MQGVFDWDPISSASSAITAEVVFVTGVSRSYTDIAAQGPAEHQPGGRVPEAAALLDQVADGRAYPRLKHRRPLERAPSDGDVALDHGLRQTIAS